MEFSVLLFALAFLNFTTAMEDGLRGLSLNTGSSGENSNRKRGGANQGSRGASSWARPGFLNTESSGNSRSSRRNSRPTAPTQERPKCKEPESDRIESTELGHFYVHPGDRIFLKVSEKLKLSGTLHESIRPLDGTFGWLLVTGKNGITRATKLKAYHEPSRSDEDINKEITTTYVIYCFVIRKNMSNLKTTLMPGGNPTPAPLRARVFYTTKDTSRVPVGELVPAGDTVPEWITPEMLCDDI